MKKLTSVLWLALASAFAALGTLTAEPPAPAKDVPLDRVQRKFPTGAKPTPRHILLKAPQFRVTARAPAQVAMVPKTLLMWGNDQYGDCVSAEECFAIAAYSVYCGQAERVVSNATVINWANSNGFLNGANLTPVMDAMAQSGMTDGAGNVDRDGPYTSVDYSTEAVLQAAVAVGPVKIGIDSSALSPDAGNKQGWSSFGGSPGQFNNEDHCVAIAGYGPTAWLAQQLGVQPPSGAPANGYLLYTWSTIGIVDHAWIMSTCGEAWVRNPTTVGVTPGPAPPPVPPVPPVPPTPGPGPTITSATVQMSDGSAQTLIPVSGATTLAELSSLIQRGKAAPPPPPRQADDGAVQEMLKAIIGLQESNKNQQRQLDALQKQLQKPMPPPADRPPADKPKDQGQLPPSKWSNFATGFVDRGSVATWNTSDWPYGVTWRVVPHGSQEADDRLKIGVTNVPGVTRGSTVYTIDVYNYGPAADADLQYCMAP